MQQQKTAPFDVRGFTLVFVTGVWVAGILLDSWLVDRSLPLPAFALLVGAGTALIFLFPLWHNPQSRLIMLLIACLFLGAYRHTLALPANDPNAVSTNPAKGSLTPLGNEDGTACLLIALFFERKQGTRSAQTTHFCASVITHVRQ